MKIPASRCLRAAIRGVVWSMLLSSAARAADNIVVWGPSTAMVSATANSPRYATGGAALDLVNPLTPSSGYTGAAIYGGAQVSGTLTLSALRLLNNHPNFGGGNDVFDLRNTNPTPANGVMTALLLWGNPYLGATPLPSGTPKNLARLRQFSYTGGYSPTSVKNAWFVVRYDRGGGAFGYMISPTVITVNRLESTGGMHTIDAKTATWYPYDPTTGAGLDNISTTAAVPDPNLIVEGVTHVGLLFQMNGQVAESALSVYKFSVTAEKWRKKAPFKALYNNDTGNVELFDMAQSAANFDEGKFNSAKLEFSIDEFYNAVAPSGGAAPFAAYMISPGYGHVPLWRSNFIDPDDHFAWWRYAHPMSGAQKLSAIGDYLDPNPTVDEDGGNVVAEVVDRCDDLGMASFVSFRPNDYHRAEDVDARPGLWNVALFGDLSNNLWRYEHPQYRVARAPLSTRPEYRYWDTNPATNDPDLHTPGTWTQQTLATELGKARQATCMNWHIPQVRDQMFALISDVVTRNPGLSGLELDFPRYLNYFPAVSGTISPTERARRVVVMTGFVARVRRLLDLQGRQLNRNYWLSVRLPHTKAAALGADTGNDVNGLDAGMLANAGVDLFVFCSRSSTHSVQVGVRAGLDPDLGEIAAEVKAENPDAALYYELTYLAASGSAYDSSGAQTANYRWSATRQQLKTIMHLAYTGSGNIPGSSPAKPWPAGIDGYSLYNFAYYRLADAPPGSATVKSEPPFDILADLMSPAAVAASPQHYLRATNAIDPDHATNRNFTLVLRKPSTNSGQWVGTARLRLHSLAAIPAGVTISVTLNGSGTPLSAVSLTTPFPQGGIPQFAAPEASPSQQILEWSVNTANLVAGVNTFTVTKTGTGTVQFRYADLSIP